VRSRERDGCTGGKLDLVRTFMVCIDGSALFLKVGVTYEDLLPLLLVTLPPNLS
jgi:hypothetical protein